MAGTGEGIGTPAAVDGYCVRGDIEDAFGQGNVAQWADLEGDEDSAHIAARVAAAVAWANNEVDDYLRGGPYAVPFDPVPPTIVNVAATLAGVWLYENRGATDVSPETGEPVHRLSAQRDRARRTLREIRGLRRRLDAVLVIGGTTPCSV